MGKANSFERLSHCVCLRVSCLFDSFPMTQIKHTKTPLHIAVQRRFIHGAPAEDRPLTSGVNATLDCSNRFDAVCLNTEEIQENTIVEILRNRLL